ncbi:protein odr-4 homolog isoform X2 [Electrophorus electricus]|uniref:protein odr-4 homolog isoform X2 n=1 Tax=Electrophorus electricus TaxID=8005 RepID=UPI0015CF97AA|nr:protein odr-4 homolog isoform X2 [Electrophorus electricus]
MGRGYIVEESVEKHLANLSTVAGSCLSGLLVGHSSAQRDFVVLAVQTPRRESEGPPEGQRGSNPLDDTDVEWVSMHARQVTRMLPGGVGVLGVFLITPPELAKEAQSTLKRLVLAVDKYMSKTRLWDLSEDDVTDRVTLHICSKTRKAVCKTFDVKDPKCSAKPADWKYQSGISSSWPVVTCSVKLDLDIPVTDMSSENLEKCLKDGLKRWAKQIESGVCLINGRLALDDSELLSGPKKSTRGSQRHTFQIQILVSAEEPEPGQRSSARVQACSGSVCVRGTVHCRAYIHSNKPKARHAAQAIKRDILNTVSSRVEMLLEDLMNEGGPASGQQDLPRRVFAPLPGSGLSVCDYVFPDETPTDVAERLKEILEWDSSVEDIDMRVEACCSVDALGGENTCDDGVPQEGPIQSSTDAGEKPKASHYYAGVTVAAVIALLATATSLLYLTE